MKPRVFILTEDKRYDTSPATKYGDRIFLNPESSPFNTNDFIKEVKERLEFFRYDNKIDFIAIVGPVQALAIFVGAVMAEYAPVEILMFSAPDSNYQNKKVCEEYIDETKKDCAGEPNGDGQKMVG